MKHIILLHGAGMNAHVWDGLHPHLAAAGYGAFLSTPVLPGHDRGDQSPLLADSSAMIDWVAGQIASVPDDRDVVLVGHSLGAVLALSAAVHPRVVAVIAIAAAARLAVNPVLLSQAHENPAAAQGQVAAWGCDRQHPQHEAVTRQVMQIMADVPDAALAADLVVCDTAALPPHTEKPLLVITGARDKMTPVVQGQALADAYHGRILVLEGGHMLPIERAPEVAAAITGFLQAL